MLLFLSLLPLSSAFLQSLFGGGCDPCQQPQQPYYPSYQPQPSYQQPPQYYQPPQPSYYPQQQGYVAAPPQSSYHAPTYRSQYKQYSIPESAYGGGSPPGYRPTQSRAGYGNDFVSEGSVPLRSSVEGERATYIMNRHGANSLQVYGQDPVRTLAPQSSVIQPTVDEVNVETNAPARQSVQVISVSQPSRPVEKLYRPTVHHADVVPQIAVEPAPQTYVAPSYEPEPSRVVESTSEFTGVEPTEPAPTLQYPIEHQGYNSVTPSEPVVPYEPSTPSYSAPEPVQPSVGYDGVKRFAGFDEDQLRASGLAKARRVV